jgi:expansin (peptidoglycan-binding protein)
MQYSVFATISALLAAANAFTGRMTYYSPSAGVGACGKLNSNSDLVVAIDPSHWTSANPSADPICGKTITISYGGKTATAVVEDKCSSCAPGAIDVSPAVFQKFGALSVGAIEVTWSGI